MSRVLDGLRSKVDTLRRTPAWRAWTRYTLARGNVLAGGMAYAGFFSLFPALAVSYTVFGLVVGGSADLRRDVTERVNEIFGATVVGSRPGQGVVTVDTLVQGNVLTVTGLVGLLVLLVSGLGWIDAMRQGVRAVFGLGDEGNPVLLKLQDVAVLVVLGLAVITSVVLTLALAAASSWSLDRLGVTDSGVVRFLVSFLLDVVLLGFDAVLFVCLVRVLARVRVSLGELGGGALIAAVGLFALKVGGGLLITVASRNRFLAATSIIVLLLWFNLASRFVLIAAAWVATTVEDARAAAPASVQPAVQPAAVVAAPVVGTRAADRVSVVAGAVLGAATVAVLGALRRGVAGVVRGSGADRG